MNKLLFGMLIASSVPSVVCAQPVLEEVFVSAQLREQNIQTVGAAATVIDSSTIESAGYNNIVDAGSTVPGLVVTTYNTANPQYFIRGVGSTGTSAGEDSSVSVFVDGAYAGRGGTSAMDFYDLDRIEVLRGAQGTLFGRNSAGGLIQLISQKPTNKNEGNLNISSGSHHQLGIAGAFNAVIHEDGDDKALLGRLSFLHNQRDGYVTNTLTGSNNLRETEDQAIRLHLLKKISSITQALVTVDYAKSDQVGASSRKARAGNNPLLMGGFIPLAQPGNAINQVSLATDGPTNRESSGVKLKIKTEFNSTIFESITAFRKNDYDVIDDVSAVGIIVLEQDESSEQWTQEFRLLSKAQAQWPWVVGIYYLSEDIERQDVTDLTAISDVINLNPAVTIPNERVQYDQVANNTSAAVYGQVQFPVTEKLDFTIGGRYTGDEKKMSVTASGADALGFGLLTSGPYQGHVSKSFNKASVHLGVDFETMESILLYGHFSQGYKVGGFDGNAASLASLNQSFDAETANTIEFGLKAQWLKNFLGTNVAVFYTDYEDLQVFQVTNTGMSFIDNAASARVTGMEVEIGAVFSSQWQTQLSCALLDNTYKKFISIVDDDLDGFPDNLKGNTLTRSPKKTCNLELIFSPVINGSQPLAMRMGYQYQDDIYITPQNRPMDTIDAYSLVNLGIRYQINNGLSLNLHGKNLTDERYKLHTFDADPLIRNNIESSVYAEGRNWELDLRFEF